MQVHGLASSLRVALHQRVVDLAVFLYTFLAVLFADRPVGLVHLGCMVAHMPQLVADEQDHLVARGLGDQVMESPVRVAVGQVAGLVFLRHVVQ